MLKLVSLDIETFGLSKRNAQGLPLPEQHHFHPQRCLIQDGVRLSDLVLTVSLTFTQELDSCLAPEPSLLSTPSTPISPSLTTIPPSQRANESSPLHSLELVLPSLYKLRPGKTMVFQMWNPQHRLALARWLIWTDYIVGFNLGFDLLFLRAYPEFKGILNGRHILLDASIFNTYHDEARCFFTLKELAITFGLSPTNWGTSDGFRYERSDDTKLTLYNATDTHITLLVLVELFNRLQRERWATTPDVPAYIITFYSDVLWTSIFMSEAGVAFSRNKLESLRDRLIKRRDTTSCVLKNRWGVVMKGTGSDSSQIKFLESGLSSLPPDIVQYRTQVFINFPTHLTFQFTEKKKHLAFSDQNRNLLYALLPDGHDVRQALRFIERWVHSDKLLTSYVVPLLDATNKSAALPFPANPNILVAYPTWYTIRSLTKEGATGGGGGGTRQSRLAARNPAAQTFPPEVAACQESRYRGGNLVSVDLSQIELRGEALMSGDPFLVKSFTEDRDMHADLAVFVEGESVKFNPNFGSGDRRKDPRQWYKQSNFLISYRGGWLKFQATLLKLTRRLFPDNFCKKVVKETRRLQRGLWKWQDSLIEDVKRTGKLTLPLTGQSRDFESDYGPEICNFEPQSIAANTMLAVAPLVRKSLTPGLLLFQNIHDALKLDCPPGRSSEGEALLKAAITQVAEQGYWHQMETLTGRHIPLSYKVTIK